MRDHKKILYFITKGNWGGAQKYVFELATNCKAYNLDAHVAIGSEGDILERKLREANIPVLKLTHLSNSLNPIKLFLSILENISVIQKIKPDVVHTNSSFAGIAIGTACFILRQKCIFTGHGWAFNENRNRVSKGIIKLAYSFVILFHNKTICVSKKVLSQVPKLFGIWDLKHKCSVVYNGINTDDVIYKSFDEVRTLNNDVLNIVTIAELHQSKNYPLVLEALEKLPENIKWNYHMIGGGEERENLEKIISIHKYKDRIYMHGNLPGASQYLKNFDLFVLGSRTEAFCFVLLEAGLAHLASIATNVGGIPEIIDNEKNGLLVETNDSKGFSKALEKLLTDESLRKELGEKLYEKVSTNFSKTKMLESTFNLY
jgi:glycosyltransferase involved in cell wall biosynthesis